ncbi:MAG TPA: TolC family protein [Vicinamibacterales bacterium]|jgi:outer membrane protein TolC|nr:TolC family protein [Vicinamibacterales bacterium]
MRKRVLPAGAVLMATILAAAAPAQAQTPPAQAPPAPQMESVSFEEAVERALKNNPTIAQAAEAVLRAEGLLRQARAATRPAVNATLSNTTLNTGTSFNGIVVIPRNQSTISGDLSMPVLAPARWAAASQARDQVEVANLSTADTRKQIAAATGQAYLAVITQHRQLEVNQRALDAARAHLDYAQRLLAQGAGTRLNELRAAQEVTSDEARLEDAGLAVRRAQEALGVLIAANGPVDAATEPTFDIPPATAVADETSWMATRTDVRLSTATERAFERVWHDSRKDYYPNVTAAFDPQALAPSGAFAPSRSWRFTVSLSQPIFDSGQRSGLAKVREAAAKTSQFALTSVQIQARSEVRLAQETIRSTERSLASQRLAAQQAGEVLSITNTAFQAGATTNLEVIDAQRSARDAEAEAEIAADAVRRARLDLLTALGKFPQ